MPAYPTAPFPLPNTDWSGRTVVPVMRTEMESGLVRQLPRFATGTKVFASSWELTNAEFETFKEFFHTDLENGTLYFDLTIPTDVGFIEKSLRFVGGEYSEAYRTHGHWLVTATLEEEVVQVVPAVGDSPMPIWFQPTHTLIVDTTLDASYANSLIEIAPSTGNTIVLTVPAISSPSDYLPFGITNQGPGSILIEVTAGGGGVVDPGETWEDLARGDMGAWGVYRFDTGVTLDAHNRVLSVQDLSGLGHHLTEDSSTATDTTTQPGQARYMRSKIVAGELVTEAREAASGAATRSMGTAFRGLNGSLSLTAYHVIAVVEFPLPLIDGFFIRLTQNNVLNYEIGLKWYAAEPPNKWYHVVGPYYCRDSSYNFPTSGSAKRIVELVMHSSGHFLFIDGVVCGHSPPIGAVYSVEMDQMGFGAHHQYGDNSKPVVNVSACIIFDDTSHLETYDGRARLERLRNLLALEFP